MQPRWKIFAPIDLDDAASGSVRHACEVADVFGGDLVPLNVLDETFEQQIRRAGWPLDASMLLLTPRRERSWTGIWRRPVTEQILRLTDLPVYVANLPRLGKDYRFECRKVMCVVNLDGTDDAIIDSAAAVASRSGARIEILHVLPEVSEGLLAMGIAQTDRPLSKDVAMDRIRALGATLRDSYTSSIAVGSLRKSIVSAAKKSGADLVILGRAKPGEWAPYCPGIQSLTRRLTCPVLSVSISPVRSEARLVRPVRQVERTEVLCQI